MESATYVVALPKRFDEDIDHTSRPLKGFRTQKLFKRQQVFIKWCCMLDVQKFGFVRIRSLVLKRSVFATGMKMNL